MRELPALRLPGMHAMLDVTVVMLWPDVGVLETLC